MLKGLHSSNACHNIALRAHGQAALKGDLQIFYVTAFYGQEFLADSVACGSCCKVY